MDKYDVIFLGNPIRTHEGSGMGRSESGIKKLCPAAMVAKG